MATNCNKDQEGRDGTGQQRRFLPSLDPSTIPLDDRKLEDILVFAKRYAELVRFYDVEEPVNIKDSDPVTKDAAAKPVLTWKEFFYKDIAVVIAFIKHYTRKLDELKWIYDQKKEGIDENPTKESFRELFSIITGYLQKINEWYTRSIDEHPLKKELEVIILSSLQPSLLKLIAYDKASDILPPGNDDLYQSTSFEKYEEFKKYPWNINYDIVEKNTTIYTGADRESRIKHAVLYVDDIFLTVLKVFRQLAERSDIYMEAALERFPEHQPHMALFIAFADLFRYAQNEMNDITRRHLEFYYRDILHLQEKPANPDAVFLIYELAKEATGFDLTKGTSLTAGKDALGKELIYKTENELVINKARVKELKTLFFSYAEAKLAGIFAADMAKSADGNGLPFAEPETAWPALGYFPPEALALKNAEEDPAIVGRPAEIGFAVSSPQLFLAEGIRRMEITIPGLDISALKSNIDIYLTGPKGWIRIGLYDETPVTANLVNSFVSRYWLPDDNESIVVLLPESEQAVVAYNEKIHGEGYHTVYPLIKIVLRKTSVYEEIKDLRIIASTISIGVAVNGVKNLILENDHAVLDNTKSMYPFTLPSHKGYTFFLGSSEIFYKKLDDLQVYFDTIETVTTPDNPAQVNFAILNDRNWKYALDGDKRVITDFASPVKISSMSKRITIHRETDYSNFPSKEKALSGFMRLDLVSDVPTEVTIVAKKVVMPPTFNIKNVSITYASVQGFEPGVEQFYHIYPFGVVEISTLPFTIISRIRANNAAGPVETDFLLPRFQFGFDKGTYVADYFTRDQYNFQIEQRAALFIGVENLVLPQNLSLLFKIADGTAGDNDKDPPKINWSYLVNNRWRALPDEHIISDGTYGLQATGIVLIDLPINASNNNTIITKGLHWLCLSVDKDTDCIPMIIDVIAQANKAVFVDQLNDPGHYRNPLPANTISKLVTKIPAIKVITQPFESFDGKLKEEGRVFYARASERLRNKNRAITAKDYESLVLEHFPWVYKVKCITHTDPDCLCRHTTINSEDSCCGCQVAPGHVLIVPVSNLRNKNAVDILKPRTGRRTLIQIEEYLKKLSSPFAHIHARNPLFEEIKVAFKVKFHTGTDKGKYLKKLNKDIIQFLTPWAFDETKELSFGSRIYASAVVNFIEELEYVDYITCFRMIHIVKGCCKDDTKKDILCFDLQRKLEPKADNKDGEILARFKTEIAPTTARAILTSARKHCIELIEEKEVKDCNCSS